MSFGAMGSIIFSHCSVGVDGAGDRPQHGHDRLCRKQRCSHLDCPVRQTSTGRAQLCSTLPETLQSATFAKVITGSAFCASNLFQTFTRGIGPFFRIAGGQQTSGILWSSDTPLPSGHSDVLPQTIGQITLPTMLSRQHPDPGRRF